MNNFTYENTKDATHFIGGEFKKIITGNNPQWLYVGGNPGFSWMMSSYSNKYLLSCESIIELSRSHNETREYWTTNDVTQYAQGNNMNKDEMLPISYVKKITPLVAGDGWADSSGRSGIINSGNIGGFNDDDCCRSKCFITSFADRPNTGKHPVGDDVVVDCILRNGKPPAENDNRIARGFNWGIKTEFSSDVISWKPNKDAMLKQYQAEQLEQGVHIDDDGDLAVGAEKVGVATKEVNAATALYAFAGWLTSMREPITFSSGHWATPAADMVGAFINLNNLADVIDFDSVKTPSDSIIPKALTNESEDDGLSTVETPAFTQGMKDSGSRLTIGMHYLDDSGDRCEYVGISASNIIGRYVDMNNVRSDHLSISDGDDIKPIQTDEDKIRNILTNALIPVFVVNYLLDNNELTIQLKE